MFAITPLLILIFGLSAGGAEKMAEKEELKAAQAAKAQKTEQVEQLAARTGKAENAEDTVTRDSR